MPRIADLYVHPVKSLNAHRVDSARLRESGALDGDRQYAIVDEDREYVNGKREQAVHRIDSTVHPDERALTVSTPDRDAATFSLDAERGSLNAWLSEYFGYPVSVIRDSGGMPDDTDASGPTVISRETLDAVAGWFDGISGTEMRRRLRPNVVIEAGEPFWEDRLYADRDSVIPFRLGDVALDGVNPCQRCVVPTRDPDTGEETEGFRERFVERRKATLPEWVDRDWYDHYFRLMVCTRLGDGAAGSTLRVGDEVAVRE